MPRRRKAADKSKFNGANLGFEEKLWAAADKLRGPMDAAGYRHVVLGLVFLKYISDAFQQRHDAVSADDFAAPMPASLRPAAAGGLCGRAASRG